MNPPPRKIRREFLDAIVVGIRERGPEAVGTLLIGLARIVLAVSVLAVLLLLQLLGLPTLGFSIESVPFAAVSVVAIALSFLATAGRQWGAGDPFEAPTQDEAPAASHLGRRVRS